MSLCGWFGWLSPETQLPYLLVVAEGCKAQPFQYSINRTGYLDPAFGFFHPHQRGWDSAGEGQLSLPQVDEVPFPVLRFFSHGFSPLLFLTSVGFLNKSLALD